MRLAQEKADAERRATEERERQRQLLEWEKQQEAERLRKRNDKFDNAKMVAAIISVAIAILILDLMGVDDKGVQTLIGVPLGLTIFQLPRIILNKIRDNP